MGDNPVYRRLLWAAAGLLLVVGLVAVPIVAGSDDEAKSAKLSLGTASTPSEGATTTSADVAPGGDVPAEAATTTPAGSAPGAKPAGATSTTAAGQKAGATTTTGPTPATTVPAEDLGTPTDPGPVVVPKDGTYRYKTTTTGGSQPGEREITTKIENKGKTGDDTRVTVTKAGSGFDSTNDTSWKPDGVRTLVSHFSFGANKGDCDWEPDALELKLPLAKGVAWTSDTSCMLTGIGPSPIPLSRSIKAEVTGLKRVKVASTVVDVWEIQRTETISGGGRSGDTKATVLYSPKHGIEVDVQGTVTSGEGSSSYHQELLSLNPS